MLSHKQTHSYHLHILLHTYAYTRAHTYTLIRKHIHTWTHIYIQTPTHFDVFSIVDTPEMVSNGSITTNSGINFSITVILLDKASYVISEWFSFNYSLLFLSAMRVKFYCKYYLLFLFLVLLLFYIFLLSYFMNLFLERRTCKSIIRCWRIP